MTVAVIVLAIALTGSLSLNAWLTHGRLSDKDKLADQRVDGAHVAGEIQQLHFELEQTRQAHAAATARATALEQLLAEEAPNANADLDPADWRTRELRLARAWAAADAHRLGPDTDHAVPSPAAADEADADLSSPDGVNGV